MDKNLMTYKKQGSSAKTNRPLQKRFFRLFQSRNFISVLFISFFSIAGITLLVLSRAAVQVTSIKTGNWSDAATWSGNRIPQAGDTVIIDTGHTVTLNQAVTPTLGLTQIKGTLVFSPNSNATFVLEQNMVVTGKLEMKPANANVKHSLRFVNVDESKFVGGGMDPLATDVGLWVMGSGIVDAQGTDKTDWTHLAGSLSQNLSTATLESAPVGWQQGDQIVIAPTEAPSVGDESWNGFDEATLSGVSGASLTLSKATTRPHPMVNNKWRAEVMNLTRNVVIEGTAGHRAHIFIRSTVPQTIKNTEIRYMGPRQWKGELWYPSGVETKITDGVLGRYSLHFHHMNEGSRGSVVSGNAIHHTGAHAYVVHRSHGVTFDSDVAYDTMDQVYWWDSGVVGPNGEDWRYPNDPVNFTHDTIFQNSIAAKSTVDPSNGGYRNTGFELDSGLRNIVRNSVAVGIQGNKDCNGFDWPETNGIDINPEYPSNDGANSWQFDDNTAHNNKCHGGFSWQVSHNDHVVNRFTAYFNSGSGFKWGAYGNSYKFIENSYYGNADTQFEAWARSSQNESSPYSGFGLFNSMLEAAGQSDYALRIFGRGVIDGDTTGGVIAGNTFSGGRKGGVEWTFNHDQGPYPTSNNFINNSWTNADPAKDFYSPPTAPEQINENPLGGAASLTDKPLHANSIVRVSDARHGNIELRRNDQSGTLNAAWGLKVTTAANGDLIPPHVYLLFPGFGDTALDGGYRINGQTNIQAFAYDNVGVSKVEFLVDNQIKCTDTTAPYSCVWDSSGLAANSDHRIVVKAYDAGNRTATHDTRVIIGSPVTGSTPADSVTPPNPPPTTFAPEDINMDGSINILDFSLLSSKFGQTANLGRADINQDGKVNIIDFSLLAAKFGT